MTLERYQEIVAENAAKAEESAKSVNSQKKDIFTTSGAKVYYYVPKGTTMYLIVDTMPTYGCGVSDVPQYIQTTSDEAQGEYLTLHESKTIFGNSSRAVLKEDCRKVTAQEYQNAQAWATATENGMKSCTHNLQEGTLLKNLHDFFYETDPHKLGANPERPKTSSLLTIAAVAAVAVWLIAKNKRTK